ncbi:hypothetical protein RCL_jg13371.t1 [Rhizophagus clarus]|uniref:Uncharacterized protein n=1 Tax=Rhizophagus clarus TaxID=94130 RepID=A0A8H3LRZ1_9GLOM|nr:hypothetical protein RCL_jg13371.t1 [Rhizophagus clarus]
MSTHGLILADLHKQRNMIKAGRTRITLMCTTSRENLEVALKRNFVNFHDHVLDVSGAFNYFRNGSASGKASPYYSRNRPAGIDSVPKI